MHVNKKGSSGDPFITGEQSLRFLNLAAPAKVTATAAAGKNTVTWSASSGATKYQLNYRINGGAWQVASNKLTGTGYTHSGVTAGAKYEYAVRAGNASGWSGWTFAKAVTGLAGTPAAPAKVTATPVAGKVTVTWSASSGAAKYQLRRQPYGGSWEILGNLTTTSYTDTTAAAKTKYRYAVYAGNASGWSAYTRI